MYNHLSMLSELLAWCLELGIRRDTSFYVGMPMQYTGGLALSLSTLLVGGEVLLPETKYDNNLNQVWRHYQKCLANRKIHFTLFMPDQIRTFMKIAKNPLGGPTILTMGAQISGEEKQKAARLFKSPMIESWGNSEGLGTITEKEDLRFRPNSIGRPFLTENVCIVTEELSECKPTQIGRLAGAEETMFVEYANRAEATKQVKKSKLILSDDIGYKDNDGYFYILGRCQEAFIVGDKTVFISDIEKKIRKIIGNSTMCIIPYIINESPQFRLAVESKKTINEKLLRKVIEKTFKVKLSEIVVIDELPRLTSGKVNRLEVAKMFSKV